MNPSHAEAVFPADSTEQGGVLIVPEPAPCIGQKLPIQFKMNSTVRRHYHDETGELQEGEFYTGEYVEVDLRDFIDQFAPGDFERFRDQVRAALIQATRNLYDDHLVVLDIQPLDKETEFLTQEIQRPDRTYPIQEITIKPWFDQVPNHAYGAEAMFSTVLRQCFCHQPDQSATDRSKIDTKIRMRIDWWPVMGLHTRFGNHTHNHYRAMEQAIQSLDDFQGWPDRGATYFPDGPRSGF